MKKITFKAAKDSLTRSEMKSIMGGSGGSASYGLLICPNRQSRCCYHSGGSFYYCHNTTCDR